MLASDELKQPRLIFDENIWEIQVGTIISQYPNPRECSAALYTFAKQIPRYQSTIIQNITNIAVQFDREIGAGFLR